MCAGDPNAVRGHPIENTRPRAPRSVGVEIEGQGCIRPGKLDTRDVDDVTPDQQRIVAR